MNIFLRVGQWLEARFPEKITAAEVYGQIDILKEEIRSIPADLPVRVAFLENEFRKVKSDLDTIKTNSTVRTGLISSSPKMTPFATRLPPVQPFNGGNQSPQ